MSSRCSTQPHSGTIATDSDVIRDMWMECLARHGTTTLQVEGASMTPLIRIGERVTVESSHDSRAIRRGDVVLLEMDGCLVVHRIIAMCRRAGRRCYRQKGDAGLESTVVTADHILGRVVAVHRDSGRVLGGRALRIASAAVWPLLLIVDFVYRGGRGFLSRARLLREGGSARVLAKRLLVGTQRCAVTCSSLLAGRLPRKDAM